MANVKGEPITPLPPLFPIGAIMMTLMDYPSTAFDATGLGIDTMTGWAICNGNNYTPNLLGQFVVCAGNGYRPQVTGGTNLQTLTIDNLPAHNHGVTDPGHSHNLFHGSVETGAPQGNWQVGNPASSDSYSTTGITIQNTGGGVAFDNRPAYFPLYFMMRISNA